MNDMRVQVVWLLSIIKNNTDYGNLRLCVSDNKIVHGFDDELDIDASLAHILCTNLWLEAFTDNRNTGDGSAYTLHRYLNLLAASAAGFLYYIAMDEEGKVPEIAWMTGTTIDNFERYNKGVL